jgi:hypothetical protein
MISPSSGYWYNPSGITHQSGGYDTINFQPGSGIGIISREVECSVPNSQMLLDVNYPDYFILQWCMCRGDEAHGGRVNIGVRVLILAVMAGVGVGYLLRGSSPKRIAGPSLVGSAELEALDRRVAELEKRPAPGELATPSIHLVTPTATEQGHPQQAPEVRPPTQEEITDVEGRRTQRFGELLANEPRDRSWASGYEQSLEDAVRAVVQGDNAPSIESVTCRTTICRAQVTSRSLGEQQRFLAGLRAQMPPMAAVHFTSATGADGSCTTTLDIVRDGYPTGAIDGPLE